MLHWSNTILVLTCLAGLLVVALRFVLIPFWKKRRKIRAQSYCPSIRLPLLPKKLDRVVEIPSRKNDALIYRINVFQLTCTCTRFKQSRGFLPTQDIRRLCRHLRKELENSNALLSLDEMHQCIIDQRVRDRCYDEVEICKTPVAIGFHPCSDFVRIYSRKKLANDPVDGPLSGPYEKYTLILSQEVWIYGTPPHHANEVIALASQLLKKYRVIYTGGKKQPPDRPVSDQGQE
ncbi:MAG: hypothetical protein HQL67_02320 [Magnetococcales bacterium]|nr:hypothetical protein [Magnetococcales bacterium]